MKKPPQSQFRLSRSNWILTVLYVLVAVGPYVLLLILRSDATEIQMEASVAATFILVITCAAYLVWRFTGRRQGVTTTVFNILIICSIYGQMGSYAEKKKTYEKGEEIRAIQNRLTTTPPQNPAELQEYTEAYDKMRDLSKDYVADVARQSTGSAKDVYTIVNQYMNELGDVAGEWGRMHDSAFDVRILDYSLLNNPAEFEYQRQVIGEYLKKNEEFRNLFLNQTTILRERLGPLADKQKNAVNILSEMESNLQGRGDIVKVLFDNEQKWGETVLSILDILEKKPWVAAEDGPHFNDEVAAQEFERLTERHDELLNRSQTLTAEFLETLGGGSGAATPETDSVQRY
ncbi:MAG: hypothetical protein KC900_08880 [Candidatus Omnitrophica bacterium]|nr:hypothetical protein [Candidatus Omnitrophota bacterium]